MRLFGSDELFILAIPPVVLGAGAMCIATMYMVAQLSRNTPYDIISTQTPTATATRPPTPTATPSLPYLDCQLIGPNQTAMDAYLTLLMRKQVDESSGFTSFQDGPNGSSKGTVVKPEDFKKIRNGRLCGTIRPGR